MDDSRIKSEAAAKRECSIYSRNCFLLDCSPIEAEE
jgi:hypothetical protein